MKDNMNAITREAIEASMKRFLAKGKKITVLPPQEVSSRNLVGEEKWSSYESLGSI